MSRSSSAVVEVVVVVKFQAKEIDRSSHEIGGISLRSSQMNSQTGIVYTPHALGTVFVYFIKGDSPLSFFFLSS